MKKHTLRFINYIGVACMTLGLNPVAQAQLTPIWTVNYGHNASGVAQGHYFTNTALFGNIVSSADTPTIDLNWGFGSPAPAVPVDRFSASWSGIIIPKASETYTFHVTSDDGVRLWLDGELLLNNWVIQSATEATSQSRHLTAGTMYWLRVEYFDFTSAAQIQVSWKGVSQPKQLVTFKDSLDGSWAHFGTVLSGLGDGRFAVAAPQADVLFSPNQVNPSIKDGGVVWSYNQAGQSTGLLPAPTNTFRREYGRTLAAFPDGRLLVGTANSTPGTTRLVGSVFLHGPGGEVLGEWPNPEGVTNVGTRFGSALAALPGNRFAATLPGNRPRVFIYDASQPAAPPLVVLTNPAPGVTSFGAVLAPFGNDRLLVADPNDNQVPGRFGSVRIYDLSGNLIRTIRNPVELDSSDFGRTVVAVDDHRFLIGAPWADAVYFPLGPAVTNQFAGAVYLYDDTGGLLRTFTGPNPARSGQFGSAMAMLDAGRVVIGAPLEQIGTLPTGRAYLFNLGGVLLGIAENPAPDAYDLFGCAVAAIDERRFVIGASWDDTGSTNAGSIYGYDAPLPAVELGSVIPEPSQPLDRMGTFPMFGPTVNPPDAAFWHVPSQKLFAVRPGSVLVSWKLAGNDGTNNWEAAITWPTNSARYQSHIAGPTPVDVSDGGTYGNAILQASTTGATLVSSNAQHWFTSSTPGDSLIMLSSGSPTNSPIRFQFVRSIAWNDPAYLHDSAPATVGSPIVDPAGYHNPACGSPQVVLPNGVFAPAPVFDVPTRTGTIIPVNRDRANTESDDLVVGFYQFGTKLYDPVTGTPVANSIAWPHKPVRFRPEWPGNAPRIVIASQQGTGALDPAQFVDWELYFQNNPTQAGFNPNDEHALRRPFGGSEAVFALRDDLGTANTSEPYVLIRYRDPASGDQWRMKVWQVVAEEAPFFFRYPAQAGTLIQAPFPLPTLASVEQTAGVSGPYFRDRKKSFWARAAGDNGGSAEIVMRYFYPMQPSFFFASNAPAPGASVPFLDRRAGTPGTPINVRFDAVWPNEVPELRVGETLVKPKNGLPQIAGQSSVEILYQQALPTQDLLSVRLIDPVRTRSVPLAQLPPDVSTQNRAGLIYFPTLPPYLERRVSYDPVAHRLQFRGEFVEPPAGESYLLLNVLTARDRALLAALTTDVAWQAAVTALAAQAASVVDVPPDSSGFDSLALTAGEAQGTGYATLAFGNSTNLSAPADPISLSVIKVTCPLYRGELKVIESSNPLTEKLTLRHSGDFAGRPEDFEFEWRALPPVDGLPSTLPPEQWLRFEPVPATGIGAVDFTIGGPGLHTLSDNYFIARYRRVTGPSPCGSTFSAWTAPMLAEGWIKRVLAGIGPFEQRIQDYQDTQVNTIISMISQAGARAVGDVALNPDAVNQTGLIELYETILRRGLALSIEGTPSVDYPPANDALLLAAGRLADLYMLLGNEAYADAADPTIAFGTDDGIYGSQATSIHCFMNQTASLLEEELGLLRGRDNSRLPSVETHPVYNRFIWNFTHDITGGEVAYALNYNIRNANDDVAGTINEADAKILYPQGHGDAWGHYLMAIKNYYRLLRSPHFTWVPRIEAVIVGGVPVSVDYLDERKFAAAAAARARSGADIVNLAFRDGYVENPARPWQNQTDPDPERAWSLSDWSARAGQGAFFDWVVANAVLPDVDPNPNHTGIQKIERANIRELPEIAEAYRQIQEQTEQSDRGQNPLGLANNVVPFDVDPGGIAAGKTHFDQINERATEALRNAVAVFDHANASTQLLRRQADDANDFQQRVVEGEADFNNRLIEVFGTPYTDDIGPTGTYPTGYSGPDIYHYDYVDSPEIGGTGQQPTLRFDLAELNVAANGALSKTTRPVVFHFSRNGFGLEKPATWTGQRNAPGEIQMSRSAVIESIRRLERGVTEYGNLIDQVEDAAAALQAELSLNDTQISIREAQLAQIATLDQEISELRGRAALIRHGAELAQIGVQFIAESMPEVVGLATDALSVPQASIRLAGRLSLLTASAFAQKDELIVADLQDEKNSIAALTDLQLFKEQASFAEQERLRQLEPLIRAEPSSRLELAALAESVQQTTARYQAAVARGVRLLEERTRFRQRTAAQIQTYRYKDMAFRVFRSDAIQKYRAQFDLAARYAYLAAKAYDYETCLAPADSRGPGSAFLTAIIRARSLGLMANGMPLPSSNTGDPGLADPLARMTANWNLVLKGQLGFNNPQTETGRFSLRNELFRILNGSAGGQRWRDTLSSYVVPNLLALPEFQRHCIPFSPTQPVEPAIVIPFATTINFGLNFFGWPAGGGDNDYDSTKFATKVRSVGVWFANYNNLGGGMINTPRVYLLPVGLDVMRSPTQGGAFIREWRVLDQALPVPFPLGSGSLSDPDWIPINDSLSEDFSAIRRFGRFRAFHDSGNFNPTETISDSRLIGRSVWNTRWLLIIPAGTLHTDRNEGIQRFINGGLRLDGTRDGNGVSDIKVFFQTYAYSGN
ncbi:MAG: PA14 domain-containing protein [Verrucomicrobia subdivision 3 bacterium]|nr:PA14 domain-containing protein [Limisphaerales bacterium]